MADGDICRGVIYRARVGAGFKPARTGFEL